MASVANEEVEHLKLSSAVVELECRKDGYYLALAQGSIIAIYSKNGISYAARSRVRILQNIHVFIDTRLDEVYISNYFKAQESSQ